MVNEVRCPGELATRLFDALYEGKSFEDRTKKYVNGGCERLDELPGSEEQIRELKRTVRGQVVKDSWTLLKLKNYAEAVSEDKKTEESMSDACEVLRTHVQECRGRGNCLEAYDRWIEHKTKEIMRDKNIPAEEFPRVRRKIDLKTLDLSEF